MKSIKILTPGILSIVFILLFYINYFKDMVFFRVKLDNPYFFSEDAKLIFNLNMFQYIKNKKIFNLDTEIMNNSAIKLLGSLNDNGEFIIFFDKVHTEKINLIKLKFLIAFLENNRSIKYNHKNTNLNQYLDLSEKLIEIDKTKVNFFQLVNVYINGIFFIFCLFFFILNFSIKNNY